MKFIFILGWQLSNEKSWFILLSFTDLLEFKLPNITSLGVKFQDDWISKLQGKSFKAIVYTLYNYEHFN